METDTLRRIEIARVAAAHIEVRFWPSRRHEGRLNFVSEGPYPLWKYEKNQRGRIVRTHRRQHPRLLGHNTSDRTVATRNLLRALASNRRFPCTRSELIS